MGGLTTECLKMYGLKDIATKARQGGLDWQLYTGPILTIVMHLPRRTLSGVHFFPPQAQ